MVEGILVVNLDPPYVSFVKQETASNPGQKRRNAAAVKHCTIQELRKMLIDVGAIMPYQQWPPRDYLVRLPGSFSQDTIDKLGLENTAAIKTS